MNPLQLKSVIIQQNYFSKQHLHCVVKKKTVLAPCCWWRVCYKLLPVPDGETCWGGKDTFKHTDRQIVTWQWMAFTILDPKMKGTKERYT